MNLKRLANPTEAEFVDATEGGMRPVVITGEIERWPAWRLWSLDYFSKKFGSRKIRVGLSENGTFGGDPEHGFENVLKEYLTFDELKRALSSKDAHKYYVTQHSIFHGLNLISKDIIPPAFNRPLEYTEINCWIGTAGNVTPTHIDWAQNLLCQIVGNKVLTIFSPEDSQFLYKYSENSKIPHFCAVDVEAPDLDRFPDFAHATPINVPLRAGEILFIPGRWWHHVRTLSDSISVNFWWLASASNPIAAPLPRARIALPVGAPVDSLQP